MCTLKSFFTLFLLMVSSSLLMTQEQLNVDGNAVINGDLSVDGSMGASALFIQGNLLNRIQSSAGSTLKLRGPNPMLEFERSSDDTPLAFFQAFGSDLFLANRLNGNLNFRTNNLNRMTINGAGDILLRTNSRHSDITLGHSNGSGASNGVAIANAASFWTLYTSGSDGNLELYFQGQQRGEFNSTTGAYTTTSDRRLKEQIRPLTGILEKLVDLKPSTYYYCSDDSKRNVLGFIAQEVQPIFPELVQMGKIGDSEEDLYTLDYSGLGVIAIAGIQELMEQVKKENIELRNENTFIKGQLLVLSRRLDQMEYSNNAALVQRKGQ